MTTPPPIKRQGKIIVERDDLDGGFLLMTPDGQPHFFNSRSKAEAFAKQWFQDQSSDGNINVGEIEWR